MTTAEILRLNEAHYTSADKVQAELADRIDLASEIKERKRRIKRLQQLIELEEQTKQLEEKLQGYSNRVSY